MRYSSEQLGCSSAGGSMPPRLQWVSMLSCRKERGLNVPVHVLSVPSWYVAACAQRFCCYQKWCSILLMLGCAFFHWMDLLLPLGILHWTLGSNPGAFGNQHSQCSLNRILSKIYLFHIKINQCNSLKDSTYKNVLIRNLDKIHLLLEIIFWSPCMYSDILFMHPDHCLLL